MENTEGKKKEERKDPVEWGSNDKKLVDIIEKAEDSKRKKRLF